MHAMDPLKIRFISNKNVKLECFCGIGIKVTRCLLPTDKVIGAV